MAARTCLRTFLTIRPASASWSCLLGWQSPFPVNTSALQGDRAASSSRRLFSSFKAAQAKKFLESHEWIELDSDGTTGTIGISKYAAKALGDVVFVELPQVDTDFSSGDTIGAVESVKSASDIMSPVGGTIIEANHVLEEKPATINKSPEGEGWIAKIKVKDTSELDDLMDADAYSKYTEEND